MNVGQGRNLFLRYLDEATSSGVPVIQSQYADYADKYNYLVNSAQLYLSSIKRIEAQVSVDADGVTIADGSPFMEVPLPDDFYLPDRVESGYSVVDWRMHGKSTLILPSDTALPVDIFYFKYPAEIPPDAQDSTEFELDADIQPVIPLQAAIEATAADNPALSAWLRSICSEKLANITRAQKSYENSVVSSYTI